MKSAAERRRLGQYFTPAPLRERLLAHLDALFAAAPASLGARRVLDPGAGSGEFLLDVLARWPGDHVAGLEIDAALVAALDAAHPEANVRHGDALAHGAIEPGAYDLVIGNPPYYEFVPEPAVRARFQPVISGRPNVFAMFFQVALDAVKEGGRVAFVVPPSMNNGAYFAALRHHIVARAVVEVLEVLDDPRLFAGAQQSVMLIVLRKGVATARDHDRHVLEVEGRVGREPLFAPDAARLRALREGHATLAELGFEVRTGRVVWNQRRADLRHEPEPGTVPLVSAHNIGDGVLDFTADHRGRPQFVRCRDPDVGPAIVVNRVVGKVGAGMLRAAIVPRGMRFVGENHVNVVTQPFAADEALFARVLAGLRSPRALETLRALTGNTQLSATELSRWIPVLPRGSAI
jgi:adenine-specific DNA-methyltransferase